jgi:DNA-directed RNA polymerase subunit RPC12/RpoP
METPNQTPRYIRCKRCNRILAKQRGNEIVFENHKVIAKLCGFIVCKGDPLHPCGEVTYLEPEKLEGRKF